MKMGSPNISEPTAVFVSQSFVIGVYFKTINKKVSIYNYGRKQIK